MTPEQQLRLECIDRALKTQCRNSSEVMRVAGEFYAFATGSDPVSETDRRFDACAKLFDKIIEEAVDEAQVRALIEQSVHRFALRRSDKRA